MGKRGPRPKLKAMDYIDGYPDKNKARLRKAAGLDELVEGFGEPFTAEHLVPDAKACIEVIQSSMPPKIYRRLDSFQLAAFALAWAVHKRAAEEVAKPSFKFVVMNAAGTPIQSPWLKILNEQARTLATVGDRLGLDPKSRQGLRSPEQTQPSKFQGLIGPASIDHSASSTLSKN